MGWINLAAQSASAKDVDTVQKIPFEKSAGGELAIRLSLTEGRWGVLFEDEYSDELSQYAMPSVGIGIHRLVSGGQTRPFLQVECMSR